MKEVLELMFEHWILSTIWIYLFCKVFAISIRGIVAMSAIKHSKGEE